jgi:hypothetical protein
MVHIVVSSIMTHADVYDILYLLQHGFRKLRLCDTHLIEFISENLEDGYRQTF